MFQKRSSTAPGRRNATRLFQMCRDNMFHMMLLMLCGCCSRAGASGCRTGWFKYACRNIGQRVSCLLGARVVLLSVRESNCCLGTCHRLLSVLQLV
jgi:hypothetical protein